MISIFILTVKVDIAKYRIWGSWEVRGEQKWGYLSTRPGKTLFSPGNISSSTK